MTALTCQSGFGDEFASEAVPGVLPRGQNSPQRVAYGPYAEQLSGTACTVPRHANRRSRLYRIRPAAVREPFAPLAHATFHKRFDEAPATPNPLRWDPWPLPAAAADFVDGQATVAGNGPRRAGRRGHPRLCGRSPARAPVPAGRLLPPPAGHRQASPPARPAGRGLT